MRGYVCIKRVFCCWICFVLQNTSTKQDKKWRSFWFHVIFISICVVVFALITLENSLAAKHHPSHKRIGEDIITYSYSKPNRNWTWVETQKIFVFSAYRRCRNTIILNAWDHKPTSRQRIKWSSPYVCCVRSSNGTVLTTAVNARFSEHMYHRASLQAVRFWCPESVNIDNYMVTVARKSRLKTLSLASLCPISIANYVTLRTPIRPGTYHDLQEAENSKVDQNCINETGRKEGLHNMETFSLAICAKLAFGNLDPNTVIAWMEYNINMGVSKIVVYIYKLNKTTLGVFQHYERLGVLVILDFDMPLNGKQGYERNVGEKTIQAWSDEQVVLDDCFELLRLYKYVAVVDFDEFIVPNLDRNFIELTDSGLERFYCIRDLTLQLYQYTYGMPLYKFRLYKYVAVVDFDEFIVPNLDRNFIELTRRLHGKHPYASVFSFTIQFHITEWVGNASLSNKDLLLDKFQKHTEPKRVNTKLLMIPGRMHLSGVHTHAVHDTLKPYTCTKVNPSVATISHYRKCRHQWKYGSCFTKKQVNTSRILQHVDQQLRQSILNKKKLLLGGLA